MRLLTVLLNILCISILFYSKYKTNIYYIIILVILILLVINTIILYDKKIGDSDKPKYTRNIEIYSNIKDKKYPPVFFINLDKDVNRKRRFVEHAKDVPYLARFSGINPSEINVNNIIKQHFTKPVIKNNLSKLSKGELGCTVSHCMLIEYIYNHPNNWDYAIICEDDALLTHYKKKVEILFNIINKIDKDFGIIQIKPVNSNIVKKNIANDLDFVDWKSNHWGTGCYIISRKGTKDIYNLWTIPFSNENMYMVSDNIIYSNTYTLTLCKPLFNIYITTSTIHKDQDKIHHKASKLIDKYLQSQNY